MPDGWATGPVTALTEYVLGLSITSLAGATWQLAPQFGDLQHVEGGFTTSLGKYSAAWTVEDDGGYVLDYSAPEGTSGVLVLPVSSQGGRYRIAVDGQVMMANFSQSQSVETGNNGNLYIIEGRGGKHRIEVG